MKCQCCILSRQVGHQFADTEGMEVLVGLSGNYEPGSVESEACDRPHILRLHDQTPVDRVVSIYFLNAP